MSFIHSCIMKEQQKGIIFGTLNWQRKFFDLVKLSDRKMTIQLGSSDRHSHSSNNMDIKEARH